jgi:ArsR family transcriptional regulator
VQSSLITFKSAALTGATLGRYCLMETIIICLSVTLRLINDSLNTTAGVALHLPTNNISFDISSLGKLSLTLFERRKYQLMKNTQKLDPKAMQAGAARACGILKVLANPDRLLLMCQLAQGEYCVSELEAMLQIGQPTLSQQLGVLRDEALVSTRREGKQIFYKIDSQEAIAIMTVLNTLYCQPAQEAQHDSLV